MDTMYDYARRFQFISKTDIAYAEPPAVRRQKAQQKGKHEGVVPALPRQRRKRTTIKRIKR